MVKAEINDFSHVEVKKTPEHKTPGTDDVDSPHSSTIDRSDRQRRSSSPKSRYRMGEAVEQPEPTASSSKKRKKSKSEDSKKSKAEERKSSKKNEDELKKKRSKWKDQASEKKVTKDKETKKKRKRSKGGAETSTSSLKEQSSIADSSTNAEPEMTSPQSAAISGSIESNTLTFVAAKGSKSSLHMLTEGQESQGDSLPKETRNTLPRRRKSVDSGVNEAFREELREASQSQHNIAGNADITVDIDPNIKVKKSGVIKEGKTSSRPSIFDQSSSPEPEEVMPISSGAVEDNLLDSEFKVKKSGVVVGRKTSSTARPSILDDEQQQSRTSPNGKVPLTATKWQR